MSRRGWETLYLVFVVVQPPALLAEMKGLRDKGYFLLGEHRRWGKERRYLSYFGDYPYCGHWNTVSTETDFQESKKLSFVSGNNGSN
jgi:hypothetical protein